MIRWQRHSEKGVTDRQTDWTIHRAAWSQLKKSLTTLFCPLEGHRVKKICKPPFRANIRHHKAAIARTRKGIGVKRHTPKRLNPRYEMNWPNIFFNYGNPIFSQIFGRQRAKINTRNTKMNRGYDTHPIRGKSHVWNELSQMYSLCLRLIFSQKFRKPYLQTDGRTDGRQGVSSRSPLHRAGVS